MLNKIGITPSSIGFGALKVSTADKSKGLLLKQLHNEFIENPKKCVVSDIRKNNEDTYFFCAIRPKDETTQGKFKALYFEETKMARLFVDAGFDVEVDCFQDKKRLLS